MPNEIAGVCFVAVRVAIVVLTVSSGVGLVARSGT